MGLEATGGKLVVAAAIVNNLVASDRRGHDGADGRAEIVDDQQSHYGRGTSMNTWRSLLKTQ